MKYSIQTPADYIAFLHGKILFAADEVGRDAYPLADLYLQSVRSASELESYLESLLEQIK